MDAKLAELHKTINDIEKIESNIIQVSSDATDSYKTLEKRKYNSHLSEVLTMETENKNIEDQIEECHENLKNYQPSWKMPSKINLIVVKMTPAKKTETCL